MNISRILFFVSLTAASTNAFSADYPRDLFAISELKFDAYVSVFTAPSRHRIATVAK